MYIYITDLYICVYMYIYFEKTNNGEKHIQ